MPYRIKDDKELGCVFVRWRGTFSAQEGAAHYREVTERESYRGGGSVFHDCRLVNADVPMSEIEKVALSGPHPTNTTNVRKVAILASSDLGFGMMRMLAALRERPGLILNVFRDLEEAKAWLGLPADIGDPFDDIAFD